MLVKYFPFFFLMTKQNEKKKKKTCVEENYDLEGILMRK